MLKKLYKLDLLWVNKFAPLFLGGALILSVASRLTSSLASVAGIILHNTLQSLAISALVGLVCNVFARSIVHFKNTLIKDESYLRRTLPVVPSAHWTSHVLTFLTTMAFCLVSILVCLGVLFLNSDLWEMIRTLISDNPIALIFLILTLISEVSTLGLSIFTSTLLGRRAKSSRNLKMGLYALAFYWGAQALLLGLAFVLGQFFPSLASVFSATDDLPFLEVAKSYKNFFILSGLFYSLYSTVLFCLGKRANASGVDVD